MQKFLVIAGCLIWTAPASSGPPGQHQHIEQIADFDHGQRNRLGGRFNAFESAPSSASISLFTEDQNRRDDRALRIKADRQDRGFCGAWMHLFDDRPNQKNFFDSRPYTHLTFWVKGEHGKEAFTVRLADHLWIAKQDSVALAPVTDYLPGGITTSWQRVTIPLDLTWQLDRQRLGGVTFEFTRAGRQTVYIDDIGFVAIPEETAVRPTLQETSLWQRPTHPKAMWVWHTPDMVRMNASERATFFEFCQRHGIGRLWMQLLYVFETPVDLGPPKPNHHRPSKTRCVIRAQQRLRRFIREAHQAGLKVHGLEGYPEFVQAPFHHCPLAIVEAVIEFNRASAAEERYDGVHFDHEPHLLIGWADPTRRRQILREYLDLLTSCQKRLREASDMVFGIDIPFWWQHINEATGKPHGDVMYRGTQKAASYHCIDIVDQIGIMNYRDTATGPDGMIAHGRDLLVYGDKARQAVIYMGIETIAQADTDVWFIVGLPHNRFHQALGSTAQDFSYLSRVNGFRLRTFDDGVHIHVGLEMPPHPLTHDQQQRVEQAMGQIAKRFSLAPDERVTKTQRQAIRHALTSALATDTQWRNPTSRDVVTGQHQTYAGVWATHVMHPKITFGDDDHEHLHQQTSAAEAHFKRHPSYGGIAIHYYKTYRHMIQQAYASDENRRMDGNDKKEN